MKTKDIIKDIKNLEDMFDFSNLAQNHYLFSNQNKKLFGKYEIDTAKNIWIDEFDCIRSQLYSFSCGNKCYKVFLNLNQNILNLKNIKKV